MVSPKTQNVCIFAPSRQPSENVAETVACSIIDCRLDYCNAVVRGVPRGTAAAAPPPFRRGNPAFCGSHPPVTPYYCRLGDLLCFVFMSAYRMFDLSVYNMYLQYFDTVGWVF